MSTATTGPDLFSPPDPNDPATHFLGEKANHFRDYPITVVENKEKGGRGVISTRPIRTGEIVFKSAPYAHIVYSEELDKFCSQCHQPFDAPDQARASRHIKKLKYCSESCRIQADYVDLLQEKSLRRLFLVKDTSARDSGRAILHALTRRYIEVHKPNKRNLAFNDRLDFNDVKTLAHFDQSTNPLISLEDVQQWSNARSILEVNVAPNLLLPANDLLKLITQFECNSFGIHKGGVPDEEEPKDPSPQAQQERQVQKDLAAGVSDFEAVDDPLDDMDLSGFGLYPMASFFNHSCRPNAQFLFDKAANIWIQALKPIPSGKEVLISYGHTQKALRNPANATRAEQKKSCQNGTKEIFHFVCGCED